MKKLLVSIDPEMYKKYKGLQRYLDGIVSDIARVNFTDHDCDIFMGRLMNDVQDESLNIVIVPANEFTYTIIHKKSEIQLGTITRINLL